MTWAAEHDSPEPHDSMVAKKICQQMLQIESSDQALAGE
jgi:hypothetical protein